MDARDPSPSPSSSSSPSAVKDGGPSDDDALLSSHAALAKEAALLFQSRRYAECVEVLKQLLQKKKQDSRDDNKEDDPKILHNIAVTEYFCDDGSDPRRLLDELDKVKKKSEELALPVGLPMEIAGSPGSNIHSGSRGGSTTLLQLSTANTGGVAYADEFDTSVVRFNLAVILYHLHEYKYALSVLLPLYQNIEPIDEPLGLHICLLLLDVALASQDASTAADVIQYLEKKSSGGGHTMNPGDNGSSSQLQPSVQQLKISAATSNIAAQENYSSDSSAGANVPENPLAGASSDDVLEFENLFSRLDGGGGHNLGRPASNNLSRTLVDWIAPASDLNLKIHLYKVRLLLLTKSQKATKREVKLAMNDARGRDSSTELILKSQVEYSRCNYNKAKKLLQACSNRTEPAMQIIFDNNLGCIYHQFGKYHLSHLMFAKALKASSEQLSEKPRKLLTFSQNKSHYIMYNCGLESLVCGKPLPAAHAFNQAASIFDNRPLFWLRSAECCLLALKSQPLGSSEGIKAHVVGSGRWRQLVVDDAGLRSKYRVSTGQDRRVSLPFARECLCKVLVLLDNFEVKISKSSNSVSASEENQANSKASNAISSITANAIEDSKEIKGSQSSNTTLQSSVIAYADMCRRENHLIKQAVLGDLAYVDLCLEDPLRALHAARQLQKLPECSRVYVFLSRVYAAEALCHLNRLQEAMDELSVYIKDANSIDFPYNEEELEKWSTVRTTDGEEIKGSATNGSPDWPSLKPEEARGALYTNIAAMMAMKGDLEQADRFVKEALSCLPSNPRATLAAVYVDLKQGRAEDALVKLRQSRHVSFLSTPASNP